MKRQMVEGQTVRALLLGRKQTVEGQMEVGRLGKTANGGGTNSEDTNGGGQK